MVLLSLRTPVPNILFSSADDGIYAKLLPFDYLFDSSDIEVGTDLFIDQVSIASTGVDWFPLILTPPGDATNDGKVTFADFLPLSRNYGRTDARWEDGDFDRDGFVAFGDFVQLAQRFQPGAPGAPESVPEPTEPSVWACGALEANRITRERPATARPTRPASGNTLGPSAPGEADPAAAATNTAAPAARPPSPSHQR